VQTFFSEKRFLRYFVVAESAPVINSDIDNIPQDDSAPVHIASATAEESF
jgi:hypothetical protein